MSTWLSSATLRGFRLDRRSIRARPIATSPRPRPGGASSIPPIVKRNNLADLMGHPSKPYRASLDSVQLAQLDEAAFDALRIPFAQVGQSRRGQQPLQALKAGHARRLSFGPRAKTCIRRHPAAVSLFNPIASAIHTQCRFLRGTAAGRSTKHAHSLSLVITKSRSNARTHAMQWTRTPLSMPANDSSNNTRRGASFDRHAYKNSIVLRTARRSDRARVRF